MPVMALVGFVDLMYPVLIMGLQTSVWVISRHVFSLADKENRLIHPLPLWAAPV